MNFIFNKKMSLLVGGFVLGSVLIIFLSVTVIPRVLITLTKANVVQQVSPSKSLIIGKKILAMADGVDNCNVDVFVLDNEGKGVAGVNVNLSGLGNLNANTDDNGKASFELKSKKAKQYELTAAVDGVEIMKTVKVTFVE